MNRKGIFLPMFVIIYMIILGALFITMKSIEANRNDLVGLHAINLIKVYDESEKINIYLDLASKYARDNTLKALAENIGYNDASSCEKTQKTLVEQKQYVMLNTCPVLNTEEEFKVQLKKELKLFLEKYESSYSETNYARLNIKRVEKSYNRLYTDSVRNLDINIEDSGNNLVVTFSDLNLPIEGAEQSLITLKPKTKIQKPDLKLYRELNLAIKLSCINKDFSEECWPKLKKKFPNIWLERRENLVKLDLPVENYGLKLVFYTNKEIPAIQFAS